MLTRARAWLAHRHAPLVVALLAVVLLLPTLGTGLAMDDHAHRAVLDPAFRWPGGPRGDWDLFRFLADDPAALRALVDRGGWPWWTMPGSRLAFFRPLSSLWHALDYRAWPDHPALMHAESVLALAGTALLAGRFYRRLLGATACAGLAALIFAVDDAHAMVVVWIANRHALLSAFFGVAALLAHDRARRDGWKPGALLAPLALAASLLAGEGGLSTLAYLFAHAVFLDPAPVRARVRALAPVAAVVVAWLVAYRLGGYGARAGAFYIDPLHQPGAFVAAVAQRLPVLLAAQLAGPPADLWLALPPAQTSGLVALSAVVTLVVGGGLFAVLRRDRTAGFFATGMALGLLPSCATWPNDRLLVFAGLGGAGLVALMLSASRAALGRPARLYAGAIATVFILFHLVLAPLLLPLRAYATGTLMHGYTERVIASLPGDEALRGKTLVVVSAPDGVVVNMAGSARYNAHRAMPDAFRVLSTAVQGSLRVGRVDDRTLSVTLSAGFFHEATSKVFRDPREAPLRVGDRVAIAGMEAEIVALTPDGAQPARVHFHFARSLDDPALIFIYWNRTGFAPLVLPAIGAERELPVVDYQTAMSG
jgi:hypothetical protein